MSLFREFGGHIFHHVAIGCSHDKHVIYHLRSNAVRNLAGSVWTGNGHYLGSQFNSLLAGTPGYVTESGDSKFQPLKILTYTGKHILGEIEGTESGCLRT
ncbi:unknown [Bacteroides sp. CAG:1060]|nr:unknown [Bacteroides sp. CAG:1060]